jgi:hypothetical protein
MCLSAKLLKWVFSAAMRIIQMDHPCKFEGAEALLTALEVDQKYRLMILNQMSEKTHQVTDGMAAFAGD